MWFNTVGVINLNLLAHLEFIFVRQVDERSGRFPWAILRCPTTTQVDFFGRSSTLAHSATQSDDTGTFHDNNRPNSSSAKLEFIDPASDFFYPPLIDPKIGFISLLFRGMSIYFGVNVLFFYLMEELSVARARLSGPMKSITKHSSPNERAITFHWLNIGRYHPNWVFFSLKRLPQREQPFWHAFAFWLHFTFDLVPPGDWLRGDVETNTPSCHISLFHWYCGDSKQLLDQYPTALVSKQ